MLPQINLLHLRFFRDAVVYNSISEAARMNYITQSAVSQGINRLEKALGVQLFMPNSRKKLQLTEQGELVFEHAKNVFRSVQCIYDDLNRTNQEVSGVINFVATKSLGITFLPDLYRRVEKEFPTLSMHVELGGLTYLRSALKQGDAEFGIVIYNHNFSQFEKRVLAKGCFRLYQSSKKIDERYQKNVLVNQYEGPFVPELQEFLSQSSNLKVCSSLSGWDVVARMVDEKMGIGFIPEYVLYGNRYPNLTEHPLQLPSYEYEICAIFNKGAVLSRAAELFIQACEKKFP